MLLSLEALRAKHGDALILHFGDGAKPQLIVIDGGPSGVYSDAFRPRLDQLAERVGDDGKLRIEVLMVSHIDDDHIRGVLDLTTRLSEQKASKGVAFDVRTLWLNAFDDLVGNDAEELAAGIAEAPARVAAASAEAGAAPWASSAQAVVASVPQGRQLRDNARGLGWRSNAPFDGFVMAPASGGATVEFGPLKLTIVCPLIPQLEALQSDWKKKLEELKKKQRPAEVAALAKDLDDSVYNLSSIVCVAELDGKRVLLTGDALGKHVLEGLEAARLLDSDGTIEVDILKLPHHGSDRNVDEEFFRRIRARHYLASGDGKHHNPEVATFRLISAARPDDKFTLHLTYEDCKEGVGEELATFFSQEKGAKREYGVNFRREQDLSLHIDLLDSLAH